MLCAVLCCAVTVQYAAMTDESSVSLCSVLCCAVTVQYAVMTVESSVSLCSVLCCAVLCCDGAVCCDD